MRMPPLCVALPILRSNWRRFHTIKCATAEAVISSSKQSNVPSGIDGFTIPDTEALQLKKHLKAHPSDIDVIASAPRLLSSLLKSVFKTAPMDTLNQARLFRVFSIR
jgi:hypothetical protein